MNAPFFFCRNSFKHEGLMGSTPKKVFQPVPPEVERVGKVVLDAVYAVHTELGPGLLESVYQVAMRHVIESSGVLTATEVKLPVLFRGVKLESGLRLDMLVDHCVIAELKAVEKMNPVCEAQLLTFSRLSNVRLGYLINFYVPPLKDGIKKWLSKLLCARSEGPKGLRTLVSFVFKV